MWRTLVVALIALATSTDAGGLRDSVRDAVAIPPSPPPTPDPTPGPPTVPSPTQLACHKNCASRGFQTPGWALAHERPACVESCVKVCEKDPQRTCESALRSGAHLRRGFYDFSIHYPHAESLPPTPAPGEPCPVCTEADSCASGFAIGWVNPQC